MSFTNILKQSARWLCGIWSFILVGVVWFGLAGVCALESLNLALSIHLTV